LNKELVGEYNKRAVNHQELLRALKEVNQMIQKAARLRVGDPKTQVVAACRKAIKDNNMQSLFKIVRVGGGGSGSGSSVSSSSSSSSSNSSSV
jgi:Bardet-Biedl syndrome 2 protein